MDAMAASDLMPLIASAEETRGALVLSVHDVAPATFNECRQIVAAMAKLGIRRCSMLVVPHYHHGTKSTEDADFVRWLRDLEVDGHEIVIHGYFHLRAERPGGNMLDNFITRHYTRGEGEFYDLTYDEALRRITTARDDFLAAGLTPHGFIAPAWLLNAEGERAARDCEMEYTTRLTEVKDMRTSRSHYSRSLVYSTSSATRRFTSLTCNGVFARTMKRNPLVRLSTHPPDILAPTIWAQIEGLARGFSSTHTATTYADWVQEQRAISSP